MRRSLPIVLGLVAALFAATAAAATDVPVHRSAAPLTAAASIDSPAASLRIDLDRLLAEHAFLTAEQMRSGLTDSPDFAAAADAVERNSTEVVHALASIYGNDTEGPIGDVWRAHIGYLVDYARSLAANDATARQRALDGLAEYRRNIDALLTSVNPGVSMKGITDALDMHTAQLLAFVDKEHTGDHAGAYSLERQAFDHMFDVGDALAKVIASRFPDRFSGFDVAYSPAGTLRVTLDRLFAEHAFLSADVMRGELAGSSYFEDARAALLANSRDFGQLIEAAYGAAAAKAFGDLWNGHITAYLQYVAAARAASASGQDAALHAIEQYASQLADFLAGANPAFDAAALADMLSQHAQHLISQVALFAKGDYAGSYTIVREGYAHMFDVGEQVAAAVAAQLPTKFPATAKLPPTDTECALPAGDKGGTASAHSSSGMSATRSIAARHATDGLPLQLVAVLASGVLVGVALAALVARRREAIPVDEGGPTDDARG